MNRKIQHTPEGVRDILNDECRRKSALEARIHQVFASFGYRDIETPTFEYFDVFSANIGTTPSNELYKFFDRDGNTLVLRPDFTPSIARAVSRFYADAKEPIRLCYRGNTFINHSSYMGRLKENTQMGVELIGDGSPWGDAEIVAMAIQTLLAAGLTDFQLSLGNVDFFRALSKAAGLDEETEADVLELIRNKNSFGVWKRLQEAGADEEISRLLEKLPTLTGGPEVLEKASQLIESVSGHALPYIKEAEDAITRLRLVTDLLDAYGLVNCIGFDLGMTSQFMYYTGIIFRGYTYGSGEAIIKGGRYNGLLSQFGMNAPSVGFVAEISRLMSVLLRLGIREDKKEERTLVLSRGTEAKSAIALAGKMRREGKNVTLRILEEGENDPGDKYYLDEEEYYNIIRIMNNE